MQSYLMHKLTDLFCRTILFAKCNILASFNLHFQWSKGIVSHPIKYGGKLFMGDREQIVLGQSIGGMLYGGLMVRSIANHQGIYT